MPDVLFGLEVINRVYNPDLARSVSVSCSTIYNHANYVTFVVPKLDQNCIFTLGRGTKSVNLSNELYRAGNTWRCINGVYSEVIEKPDSRGIANKYYEILRFVPGYLVDKDESLAERAMVLLARRRMTNTLEF
jgi:hypothetical protein